LRISQPTAEAAQIILQTERSGISPLTKGADFALQQGFSIPRELPCFLVMETQSNLSGRVNLFLDPVQLPPDLQEIAANQETPAETHSFQAVIDTTAGEWQRHTLDVASDFFETVRAATLPYDPSGITIGKIRIAVAEPYRPELEISIRGLRIVELTGRAMKMDLSARSGSIAKNLRNLSIDSLLRRHWEPRLSDLVEKAETISESTIDAKTWRQLAQDLDHISLQSTKWSLTNLPDRPYAIGIESSLRRISGNHPGFTFGGKVEKELSLDVARNEYESFQLVILPLTTALKEVRLEVDGLPSDQGTDAITAENLSLFHQIEQFVLPSRGTAYDWRVGCPTPSNQWKVLSR